GSRDRRTPRARTQWRSDPSQRRQPHAFAARLRRRAGTTRERESGRRSHRRSGLSQAVSGNRDPGRQGSRFRFHAAAASQTETGNTMTPRLRGALAPVLTPFTPRLEPDEDRFIAHCRWLVDNHAGLAIFGTNSEAASLSVEERLALTDALLEAGIPASKLLPGTGACSIKDAVMLTRHAVENDAAGVLMIPPFYYKGVSDDGVFAYYSEVIEQVSDARLALYLYHFPQLTQVPITLGLIERLLKRYPQAIAGAKDSSGDWNTSKAMIEAYGGGGFDVFPASEALLSKALAIGGAGCISAK